MSSTTRWSASGVAGAQDHGMSGGGEGPSHLGADPPARAGHQRDPIDLRTPGIVVRHLENLPSALSLDIETLDVKTLW
jgi:hypothetical protein